MPVDLHKLPSECRHRFPIFEKRVYVNSCSQGALSAGVAALATGLRFAGPRHKVVLTDWEFPTIGQIWHAQESRGARVVHVREDESGQIHPRSFRGAIDEETKLVSVTHVCYRN